MKTRPRMNPLFWLFHHLFPPERPTEMELIAYGEQLERQRHVAKATVFVTCCDVHLHQPLQHIGYGFYRCALCQRQEPSQRDTDPIAVNERPFLAYRREQHRDIGRETQEHRAAHLERKER